MTVVRKATDQIYTDQSERKIRVDGFRFLQCVILVPGGERVRGKHLRGGERFRYKERRKSRGKEGLA